MNELIIQSDSYDFDERLENPTVLVYFYDHMNVQCRGFEMIIEEVAEKYSDSITVLSVDIEQSPDLAYRYGIESTPYVILFSGGEPAADMEGANLPNVYCDMIESYL